MKMRFEIQWDLISFQIEWVDFGYTETVHFEYLSSHIEFAATPIQVKKFHLSNVVFISDQKTAEARVICTQLVCNQLSDIFVNDNIDAQYHDSIACNIRLLNEQLDLSTVLISRGFVHHDAHSDRRLDEVKQFQVDSKRMRKQTYGPIIKDTSELRSFEDFEEFYRAHKAKNSINKTIDHIAYDEESRMFEIFEPLSLWKPLSESLQNIQRIPTPNPMVDQITKHFKLMTIKKSVFDCRCAYIIDPVTLLVQLYDVKRMIIRDVGENSNVSSLEGKKHLQLNSDACKIIFECLSVLLCLFRTNLEHSPVVAFYDSAWRRGILWEKTSQIRHRILFVDTLQIDDVHQNLIQKCPPKLLDTVVPFVKVHLNGIRPNARMRALDICNELNHMIMNKGLVAYIIERNDNGVPEVILYESEQARRPIYKTLIKQNFYKKIPNSME